MVRMAMVVVALLWYAEGYASVQQAGFVLLRDGVGARAVAMGEAHTAVVGDQTAAFWNPAGVAAMRGKDFVLAHHRSFQGINQGYGGWAYGNGSRGLALSLGVYGVGGLEARVGPSLDPAGTFSVYALHASVSYAQRIGQRIYAGFSARALHENIGPESAWGTGVDLGLLCQISDGITVGVSYRNLGQMDVLDRERTPLPREFRAGVAVARGAWTGAVDVRVPENGRKGLNLGLEYAVAQRLLLRGGYVAQHDTRDWSLGFGLVRKNWRIDYAFVPVAMGLGGSHRVGIGIR